jgi:CDGSH-type Zn-finger protein
MGADAPKIACLSNGPYYLLDEPEPQPVPFLQTAAGQQPATARGVALCRCGGSANKPFCDGTHGRIGFSDAQQNDRAPDRQDHYRGEALTIHDNRGICAHAGHCTDSLPAVFRMHEEPWIDADGAPAEEVERVVRGCPSGALSFSRADEAGGDTERAPMVTVTKNGPYAVTGGIELIGVAFGEGASREHYTLCRCGASRNKPFCDGSHWRIGFTDEGG